MKGRYGLEINGHPEEIRRDKYISKSGINNAKYDKNSDYFLNFWKNNMFQYINRVYFGSTYSYS